MNVLSELVSKKTFERLAEKTVQDADLQSVVCYINENSDLKWRMKLFVSELLLVQGIVLRRSKVVIPKPMRQEMLQRIDEGNLRVNKCKARAGCLVFWPSLNSNL